MSTCVYEQDFDKSILSREYLIGKLRSALSAAESGEDVVTLEFGSMEFYIDFDSGEVAVIA